MRRLVWFLVVLLALLMGGAGCGQVAADKLTKPLTPDERVQAVFPSNVRSVLDNADRFELVAIKEEGAAGKAGGKAVTNAKFIQGYSVVKRIVIGDRQTQAKILRSVYGAVRSSDGLLSKCFSPHHAIVATRGGNQVTAVMCFQCQQIQTEWNGKEVGGTGMTANPKDLLNGMLKVKYEE